MNICQYKCNDREKGNKCCWTCEDRKSCKDACTKKCEKFKAIEK